MPWVQFTTVASIVGGACTVGICEYLINRRRERHAMLVKRYNNLPKRPDTWSDDIDWDNAA
jgi:hypothetical protein